MKCKKVNHKELVNGDAHEYIFGNYFCYKYISDAMLVVRCGCTVVVKVKLC